MQLQAEPVKSVLRVGPTLAAHEAERAVNLVQSVSPFSHLVVDLTRVRECQDAAFVRLIGALKQLADVSIDLQGVTSHQRQLLKTPRQRDECAHRDAP